MRERRILETEGEFLWNFRNILKASLIQTGVLW